MNDNMKEDVLRVLLSEDEIREKVRELGGKITADYKNSNLMLVTVLKGAVVFLADLMRQIDVPAEIDFMVVSSYGSGGQIQRRREDRKGSGRPPCRQGYSDR